MASEAIEEALTPRARECDIEIGTDAARLDIDMIHGFLAGSYWAAGIPREVVERAVRHSLCFGAYLGDRQVGFARVDLRSCDLCLRQRRVRGAAGAGPGRRRPAHGGHHGASRSAGPPALDALHARRARAVPALRVRRRALPRSADGGLDGPVRASAMTPLEAWRRGTHHSPSRCVRQILVAYDAGSRRGRRGPQP